MISRQRPALKWSNGEKLNFKRLDRCPPNILEALLTIAPTSNLVSIFGLSSRDDFYAVFTDELKFFIKKNPREFENDASLIKKMKLHLMSCGLLLQEEQITTGGDDTFEFRPFLDLLPPPFDEKIEEKVLHTIANLTLALERDANTEKVKNNTQNFDFLNDLLDENSFASRIRLADKNFAREQEIDFLKLFEWSRNLRHQSSHGDLHLSNVLVTTDSNIFVSDFDTMQRSYRPGCEDFSYFCMRYLFLKHKQTRGICENFFNLSLSIGKVSGILDFGEESVSEGFLKAMEMCCYRNLALSTFHCSRELRIHECKKFLKFKHFVRFELRRMMTT